MKRKNSPYVFLESGAFLADPIFQAMTAEQRGIYCTIIFHLYENNGRFPLNMNLLKRLCNCENFEKVWEFVEQKFKIKNGIIFHKRVSKELKAARQRLQLAVDSGVIGAKKRWGAHSSPNRDPIANRIEAKRIEENRNISNSTDNSQDKSLVSPHRLDSAAMNAIDFYDRLTKIFTGRTPSDTTSLRNLVRWVKDQIAVGKFNNEIVPRILDMAADSKNGKSRKPIAVFFAQMKRDLGYKTES